MLAQSTSQDTVRSHAPQRLIIGGYEVLEAIGTGGSSRVHRARHVHTQKVVAIKILNMTSGDPNAVGRFLREARTTALIRHPNVVEVFDVGQTPHGAPYIIMELLDGESLSMVLDRKGHLSWEEAREYLRQICDGLQAAHEAGIVHRDLKLTNCIVTEHNGQMLLKIVDFGLAKPTGPAASKLTALGSVLGTPEYMSPEQATGSDGVDHLTDVYAVGIMAYELLTGSPPYTDTNYMRVLMQHQERPVPSPSIRNPSLSRGVDALLFRALAKEKFLRIPSMKEFAQEIEMAHTKEYAKIHYRTAILGAVGPKKAAEQPAITGKTVIAGHGPTPPESVVNAATPLPRGTGAHAANAHPCDLPDPHRLLGEDEDEDEDEDEEAVRTMLYVHHRQNVTWIIVAALVAVALVGGAAVFSFL